MADINRMNPEDPDSFNHCFADVNGMRMHYVDEGKGPITVVLVHGWPDLWYGWRHQIRPLVDGGYRVVVPDMRGYGQTSKVSDVTTYRKKNIAKDLVGLLDLLNVKKAVFIGHDWGGVAVWRVALHHPDRVLAVAGVCTPYHPPLPKFIELEDIVKRRPAWAYQLYFTTKDAEDEFNSDPEKVFVSLLRTMRPDDRVKGARMMKDGKSALGAVEGNAKLSPMLSERALKYYVDNYSSGFGSSLNWYKTRRMDFEDELDMPVSIDLPALMITAGQDPILTPELSKHMEMFIPGLTRGHVENAGHFVQQEEPESVNRILLKWLATLPLIGKL